MIEINTILLKIRAMQVLYQMNIISYIHANSCLKALFDYGNLCLSRAIHMLFEHGL